MVRKVSWDRLWHALYRKGDGRVTWDRKTQEEALAIVAAGLETSVGDPHPLP